MNKKRGGILFIVFGLVAAVLVGVTVFRMSQESASQKVETVDVLVALQDIPERTVLTPALVGVKPALPATLPPGALTRPEQVNGRMSTSRIYAGEVILPSRLVDTGGRSGVSYSLEKGKVLVTLPASDIVGTGAVRQGDHVDLLVTLLPSKEQDRSGASQSSSGMNSEDESDVAPEDLLPAITQTTMQNLVIVGIGPFQGLLKDGAPEGGNQPQGGNLLTFAVNHDDALRLKAMKDNERVKMELVLRAAGDDDIVETAPVTLQTLLELYRIED